MKYLILLLGFYAWLPVSTMAQEPSCSDSIRQFRERYISEHDVVLGEDRAHLRFFPVDTRYCVAATLERIYEAPWFPMETSGTRKKTYRVYGILHFTINDSSLKLHIYQSKDLLADPKYADYLFIPFTDRTSGEESYDNGRYIDLRIAELESGTFRLDFNKAYNPSCAYVSNKYNCPVPPPENQLDIAIRAGEMKYEKNH